MQVTVNSRNAKGVLTQATLLPGDGLAFVSSRDSVSINLVQPIMRPGIDVDAYFSATKESLVFNGDLIYSNLPGTLKIDDVNVQMNQLILIETSSGVFVCKCIESGTISKSWKLQKTEISTIPGTFFFVRFGRINGNKCRCVTSAGATCTLSIATQDPPKQIESWKGNQGIHLLENNAIKCLVNTNNYVRFVETVPGSISILFFPETIDVKMLKNYKEPLDAVTISSLLATEKDKIINQCENNAKELINNSFLGFSSSCNEIQDKIISCDKKLIVHEETIAKHATQITELFHRPCTSKVTNETTIINKLANVVINKSCADLLQIDGDADELIITFDKKPIIDLTKVLIGESSANITATIKTENNELYNKIVSLIPKIPEQKALVSDNKFIEITARENEDVLSFNEKLLDAKINGVINNNYDDKFTSFVELIKKETKKIEQFCNEQIMEIYSRVDIIEATKEQIAEKQEGNNAVSIINVPVVTDHSATIKQLQLASLIAENSLDALKKQFIALAAKISNNNSQSAQNAQKEQEKIPHKKALTCATIDCRNTKENNVPLEIEYVELCGSVLLQRDFILNLPVNAIDGQQLIISNTTSFNAFGSIVIKPKMVATLIHYGGRWKKISECAL